MSTESGEIFHDIEHLTSRHILSLRVDQTRRYGGARGVNMTRLHSLVGAVRQTWEGELLIDGHVEAAAAYLYYIIQSHPFRDGNIQTGIAAALAFLRINGYSREWLRSIDQRRLSALGRGIARGWIDRDSAHDLLDRLLGDARGDYHFREEDRRN